MKRLFLILFFLFTINCSKITTFEENELCYHIEYTIDNNLYQYDFYGTQESYYELLIVKNQNILIVWIDKNTAEFAIKSNKEIVVLQFLRI